MEEGLKKTYAVFFAEGATEVVFYHALIEFLAKGKAKEELPIVHFVDLKGVNHFPQKVDALALNLYIKKHPADAYHFFLCYDHDLFPEPPVNWEKVRKGIKHPNVYAHFICAKEEIEDWFFLDEVNLKKYLKLPSDFDLTPYKKDHDSGLRKLFWKQHKVYHKGARSKALIHALSFPLLIEKIGNSLDPIKDLYKTPLDS